MRYNLAPIVLFVHNRPEHTFQTLEALNKNELASESILYIFADGPKENASLFDLAKIEETRKILRNKLWCKEVVIRLKETNAGLANSITQGVTEIVNQYGSIIVLEDDIVTSKGFLCYMNNALNVYKNEESVMHISGYMYPHKSRKLEETFFYPLPYPGGGWASWKRAWKYYNNNTQYLFDYFEKNKTWNRFNSAGGNYFKVQLEENLNKTLKTWFIKWHASLLIKNGLTLFPRLALTKNIGFDNSGIHSSTTNKFDNLKIADKINVIKKEVKVSKEAEKIIKHFYSDLFYSKNKVSLLNKCSNTLFKLMPFKKLIRGFNQKLILSSFPELLILKEKGINWEPVRTQNIKTQLSSLCKIYSPNYLLEVSIGDYSYVAKNSNISHAQIGKFCSIGPNFLCGWGIHPTNGISTSPMFYSTMKQNGMTLSSENKVEERKQIIIGNDVFIGANVTVLDGVKIGDGAVIGAGAVVSKDISPYAIAVGNPIKIIKYRFTEAQIIRLLKIEWWNFDEEKLKEIERDFFNIEAFLNKYDNA